LDYGLVLDTNAPPVTSPGADRFIGTYKYAAPETIFEPEHDKRYSPKSDLYSLGATLYFLLYGFQVFESFKNLSDLMAANQAHKLTLNGNFSDSVLKSLEELCKLLLAPDPNERPSTAAACWELLVKSMPSTMPFRVYFACALTNSSKRQYLADAAAIVKRAGE